MPPFILNIPNALTILRLFTVPLCTVPLLPCFGTPTITTLIIVNVIFILGSITDYLDGYFARKLNQMSEWGAYMDPLIDKYLIWALYFVFTMVLNVPLWTFLVILFRDLAVTQMRNYALKHQIKFKTSFLAKCKTASQMIIGALILIFLLVGAYDESLSDTLMNISCILIQVVAVFTFITGVDYAYTLYKLKNNNYEE